MSIITTLQATFTDKTNEDLFAIAGVSREGAEEADRAIVAAICEELITRNPQVAEAVAAWSEDLDDESELIDLLAKEIA